MSATLGALMENVLIAHGVDDTERGPHSWRCGHPDRYPGHCTCIADLVRDLMAAVAAAPSSPAAPLDGHAVRRGLLAAHSMLGPGMCSLGVDDFLREYRAVLASS